MAAPPPDEEYKPSVFFPNNARNCATDNAIIQFASTETAMRAGLTTVPAISVSKSPSAEAPAEIAFDETRSFAVTTLVPTSVARWCAEPGQNVTIGMALAEVESPDMPRLKAEYLDAVTDAQLKEQDFRRADSLVHRGLISTAESQQMEGAFRTAQSRLSATRGLLTACGLNDEDLERMRSNGSVAPRWLLHSPASGALLERKAALGELLPAGSSLALIGDPAALWIEAHVRESDLSLFRRGQNVEFGADGGAVDRARGRIIWVAQYIDPLTRTGLVRSEVTGDPGELKAHLFGRMYLSVSVQASTVAVPTDAVQWEGCCNVVFVQEAADRYRPHKVTVRRGDRGYYNITSGLQAGDRVVVKGSYLLKTELQKGSLGAGCCDVAPQS